MILPEIGTADRSSLALKKKVQAWTHSSLPSQLDKATTYIVSKSFPTSPKGTISITRLQAIQIEHGPSERSYEIHQRDLEGSNKGNRCR